MQEEMNEKTVSLIIRGTKVTAVVLKDAYQTAGTARGYQGTRSRLYSPGRGIGPERLPSGR